MDLITPKQAIALLANGWDERTTARRDIAELVLRLETVAYNAAKVSLDVCEGCDWSMKECSAMNIDCPNKSLRDSLRAVKL